MLSVFSSLTELEDKIKTLEEKLNEPYDASNEEYHNKLIKDYTLSQELYENRDFAIVMCDIDNFKKINETKF